MNQQCKVCGEPAAGFHFGAFTCEGCKSFFGRSYNNLGSITECKNNGECVINKKNRTACKACRLRKCLLVGMSKSGSRYGRRSNWFKIHCLLQEQQQAALAALRGKSPPRSPFGMAYPQSAVPSPDSESSDSPFMSLSFPSMFMRPPPFLLHPQMFPFPPTPPLKPPEEDCKPILNNNNYDSKNNNIEKDPKRFYLDTILGLKSEAPSPSPSTRDTPPLVRRSPSFVQDDPIDLSVRSLTRPKSRHETLERRDHRTPPSPLHRDVGQDEDKETDEEEDIDVVHGLPVDESKTIPLDLSV